MIRSSPRPLGVVSAAMLLAGILLAGAPTARAAESGLVIVTHARYVAIPAERRIAVTVDVQATNATPDPPGGRYDYLDARLAVQPAIRNLAASSGSRALVATIAASTSEYTSIDIAFGRSLFHGESISFRFSFDIVDPGGAPQRDVRVAASLVAFPVWAFGSAGTPGSSVSAVFPAQYTASVVAGQLTPSSGAGGTTILSASNIPDPTTFFAYVTAERPGAFVDSTATPVLTDGKVDVRIRAWDDDAAWGARESELITRGLPVLQDLIGLPYLVHGELTVEEAAVARLGDYAGIYNSATEIMRVRYDADDTTTLHEAAHTWFNANLFNDRWILEAWAEYYAVQAGKQIGAQGQEFVLTPALQAAKIPLNAWGAIGAEPPATENYAYAASYRLAQLLAARATIPGLQQVWRAAEDHESAYQPAHPGASPEMGTSASVEGWQQLLDLLDERTGKAYEDLFRSWVVTSAQESELQQRDAARADYQATVKLAGAWELPYEVRYEMDGWQFNEVTTLLAAGRAVLADRDRIASQAKALDLQVPARLEQDFEQGTPFTAAESTARDELAALSTLAGAREVLGRSVAPLEWVGLIGEDPGAQLAAARTAFEQGDAGTAQRDAAGAEQERSGAADVGRLRVAVAGGSLLVLDGFAMGGLALARRRRRARATSLAAAAYPAAAGPSSQGAGDTLPIAGDTPDQTSPTPLA